MKKIQISLNAMEAKVYELCKSATKGSDNGAMFCFDEVAVPAKKELGLSVEEVKGYLGSLKKKDAIRKLHESYYDFFVPEKCEDDYDWPYMDELYTVEITIGGAEKPAPSTKKIRIYQINATNETSRTMLFMPYDIVVKHFTLSLDFYDMVYEGQIEGSANLDDIYTKFNINRPADFKGHSLSTSDIVEVDGKFFYCDSYGWEEVFFQSKTHITFSPDDIPEEVA